MKRRTRKRLFETWLPLLAVVVVCLLLAWEEPRERVIVPLTVLWIIFSVGNVLVFSNWIWHEAKTGEKPILAAILAILVSLAILILIYNLAS